MMFSVRNVETEYFIQILRKSWVAHFILKSFLRVSHKCFKFVFHTHTHTHQVPGIKSNFCFLYIFRVFTWMPSSGKMFEKFCLAQGRSKMKFRFLWSVTFFWNCMHIAPQIFGCSDFHQSIQHASGHRTHHHHLVSTHIIQF